MNTNYSKAGLPSVLSGVIFALVTATCISPALAVPVTLISDNPGKVFRDIATDGTSIYTQDSGAVYSLPTTGGGASFLYAAPVGSPSTNIFGVTVIGSNIFWGDNQSGPVTDTQIFSAPKAGGGTVTAIYTGSISGELIVDITGLETDGTKLYSADAVQGRVYSLNPDGTGITQIGPNRYGGYFAGAHENSIAVGEDMVFIGESGVPTAAGCFGLCNPGIYVHSALDPTGVFDTLFAGLPFQGDGIRGIAYGDGKVFATQGDSIYLLDANGGPLSILTALSFHDLRGITYDNNELYVVDQFAGSGRILRVDLQAVPEPAAVGLMIFGLLLLWLLRRPHHSLVVRNKPVRA